MKRIWKILIVALVITNLTCIGGIIYLLYQFQHQSPQVLTNTIHSTTTEFYSDVTSTVDKVASSVVAIESENRITSSTGSGVIIESDDQTIYIVTNAHVIENGETITVTFANGQRVAATLVGSDTLCDLALLSVMVDFEVNPIALGDSSLVHQGEFVVAIGSPLGLDYQGSTSFGIISGTNRTISVDLDDDGQTDWDMVTLQTDAAINVGNSGGALVNLNGELVGITSMRLSSASGTNVEGMGFAIPVNEMIPIVEQLKDHGYVIRPSLGISGIQVSQLTVYQKNYLGVPLNQNEGILIVSINTDGAAAKAGIAIGDIITSIDGSTISTFKDFRTILYSHAPQDVIRVTVLHMGELIDHTVTLE